MFFARFRRLFCISARIPPAAPRGILSRSRWCWRAVGVVGRIWPTSRECRHVRGLAARVVRLNDRGTDQRYSAGLAAGVVILYDAGAERRKARAVPPTLSVVVVFGGQEIAEIWGGSVRLRGNGGALSSTSPNKGAELGT